jgi:hypothetical protein
MLKIKYRAINDGAVPAMPPSVRYTERVHGIKYTLKIIKKLHILNF